MAVKLLMNFTRVTYTSSRYIKRTRLLCDTAKNNNKNLIKQNEPNKLSFYILNSYVNYIKRYEKVLEKRFPKAISAYRLFLFGVKEFYKDLKGFYMIVKFLRKGNTYLNLNRSELELYYQMPRDILKLLPVLVLASLPLSNYLILPLIIYFPRQLLTSHFWNLQQKTEFRIIYLKKRLTHHRPVFRHLQGRLNEIDDKVAKDKWASTLGLLGSGVQPTIDDILECKDLFQMDPYKLNRLRRSHIKLLAKMHGIQGFWFKTRRLDQLAKIIYYMDLAITREGGVQNLSQENLRTACIIRGLNPTNMRNEDMTNWLTKWIHLSMASKEKYPSLLLHSPILLGYNEPSNWILIYSKKK